MKRPRDYLKGLANAGPFFLTTSKRFLLELLHMAQRSPVESSGLFKIKDFNLLFSGEVISAVGDQCYLVAISWLVVKLTGSGLAVGVTLALAGFPRAVLMLLGGAVTDRFSSRTVMLVSNVIRLLITGTVATMVFQGSITMPVVYTAALLFGIADAFFMPAQSSIIPQIVPAEKLGPANTFVQGSYQLAQFIGPFSVGALIGFLERGNQGMLGIAIAMLFDAITFVISLVTVWFISVHTPVDQTKKSLVGSMFEALVYVWQERGLRCVLITATVVNFLVIGPYLVGMPVLAKSLPEGAFSYGSIIASWGLGTLIGYALGGFTRRPKVANLITYLLGLGVGMGFLLFLMGFSQSTIGFVGFSLAAATIAGYITISFLGIVQRTTERRLIGRVMGIMTACYIGLNPVSEIVTGSLVKYDVHHILQGSGLLIMGVVFIIMLLPDVQKFGLSLRTRMAPEAAEPAA